MALSLAAVRPAEARFTEDERLLDDTAYVLRPGEIRMGFPGTFSIGLPGRLQLGVDLLPLTWWLPNGHAKLELRLDPRWSLGLQVQALHYDATRFLFDGDEAFVSIPIGLTTSHRLDVPLSLHVSVEYTIVHFLAGRVSSLDEDPYSGLSATTNLQVAASLVWHRSDRFAWVLRLRWLPWYDPHEHAVHESAIDATTTVLIAGQGTPRSRGYANAWSVAAAAMWSWAHFNLRVGAGFGHFNIPIANFAVARRLLFPDLALYWRW